MQSGIRTRLSDGFLKQHMERRHDIYEFGDFRLNPSECLLLRNGIRISVPNRALAMLLVLVQRSGHLVEKSELINTVWDGAFVEEANVAVIISILRKALGDDRNELKYIETVSKKGYRFVAKVVCKEDKSRGPAGVKTAELCREHGISAATFYRWKQKFGEMDVSEARLKALEDENRRLKLLVAELSLRGGALKGVIRKNRRRCPSGYLRAGGHRH